jgi:hypothetical protein
MLWLAALSEDLMSPGLATTYQYRLAIPSDVSAIFAVLKEVAPEIPVLLNNSKRQMEIFKQIYRCIDSGEVWIALDRDNQVVGFLLAEPYRVERFPKGNQEIELLYGGVRPGPHRGKHIFPTLVKKVMAKRVPLTATVMHANDSHMLSRLLKLGFTKEEAPCPRDHEDFLRRQP